MTFVSRLLLSATLIAAATLGIISMTGASWNVEPVVALLCAALVGALAKVIVVLDGSVKISVFPFNVDHGKEIAARFTVPRSTAGDSSGTVIVSACVLPS